MSETDWNAVWAAVQGICSIVAIAVAVWLGERQHRRSIELIEDERHRLAEKEKAELLNWASWVATALAATHRRAVARINNLSNLTMNASNDVPTAEEAAMLSAFVESFRGDDWELTSPHTQAGISRFPPGLAAQVIGITSLVQDYRSGLANTGHFIRTRTVPYKNLVTGLIKAHERAEELAQKSADVHNSIVRALNLSIPLISLPDEHGSRNESAPSSPGALVS